MHIVVTGGDGFIGKSLRLRLKEHNYESVVSLTRASTEEEWSTALAGADLVFHIAGVNRPTDPHEFVSGNAELTARVCGHLSAAGRQATLVLTSSTQAEADNPYGVSKREAEAQVRAYAAATGARGIVLRLPNVFGKWARPGYNSAVATFCHNTARGLPITVHAADAPLRLVYIDDVLDHLMTLLTDAAASADREVVPVYQTTVGAVAEAIAGFRESRQTLTIPAVGTGLLRALYATYLSYLQPEQFDYPLTRHEDARGAFSEMLRTADSGQFSFFTAHPGITRGEHYHHTKNEKFLVVQGQARFAFRQVLTGERFDLDVSGTVPRVVETVPGWSHNITNIGETEMIVLLWANEAFDPSRPDTIAAKVVS